MKKRKCVDGLIRTEQEYYSWIRNLGELAMQEPQDLTDTEQKALLLEGWQF